MSMGRVYLIGAGPGDPELITIKGLKILQEADVVIYDRLINEDILKYARRAKELICVGKEKGESWKQKEINELLIKKAKRYEVVVRLKNGDPMLFGRVAEECEALKEAGILYEIIPGISSALAAAAYSRIPITHRDYSSTIAIVTGHRKEDYNDLDYLIPVFKGVDTTIVLMGMSNLEKIVNVALSSNLSPDTPVAIIENVSLKNERMIIGNLQNIIKLAKEMHVKPPAIIIFGKVVELRNRLV